MASVKGIIIDVVNRKRIKGEMFFENGIITEIRETEDVPDHYILPGFIDSHIHIESSMLVPSEFARMAVKHGTVATVSDPHEIANVCGIDGVEFMVENGRKVPLKFHFGAPSCVPATPFETAGDSLSVDDVDHLLGRDDILYLAEMMNWPGVLYDDPDVLSKIEAARIRNKPVDGHAPGLKGDQAEKYASAGISTDHECFTRQEALDKLKCGMKIAIREGSAAKNYSALSQLISEYPGMIMLCSDDKHPDDLEEGHINQLVVRSLEEGHDLYDVLEAACVVPVRHYNLNVGLLKINDPADFIVVEDLESMKVQQTWIDGEKVFDDDQVLFSRVDYTTINNFTPHEVTPDDFKVAHDRQGYPVIVARDGELITEKYYHKLPVENGWVLPDFDNDILKIAVVNRYEKSKPAVGFIQNFGLKTGAIASSVAHDSHNVIAIGTSDNELSKVVNLVMENHGGIAATDKNHKEILPLPVAGIMTNQTGLDAAKGYEKLNIMAAKMGSKLHAPFMLISFMALLVIPSLKMSDKGIFDGEHFEFLK